MSIAIEFMERGWLPDWVIRAGIRRLLKQRLRDQQAQQGSNEQRLFFASLRNGPLALHTEKANQQHYELPAEFFQAIMGQYLKYSACYWPKHVTALDAAEATMLQLTCERAAIEDGHNILELGCGWGSLSLWLAEHYPQATITAISNSAVQRQYIERQIQQRKLNNLSVITVDINDFQTEQRFDRVVSVEMFEHMRNYRELLARIANWLQPDGKLFVHVFSHREYAYPFEAEGDDNWMGRYFFTGGLMPAHDLFGHFNDDLTIEQAWQINGQHYQRTCEAWLANQDQEQAMIRALFKETYGEQQAARWFQRWRIFFMACAELFGYDQGRQWGVSHYRFRHS